MTLLLANNDGLGPLILIVVVIAIVIGAVLVGKKARDQRRAELSALALELGCSFDPGMDEGFSDMFARFDIFQKGHSRAAYNSMQGRHTIGSRPFPLRMGDYTYKVSSSDGKTSSTRTERFSYLLLFLPFATPDLLIRREGMMDKIVGALGFHDINFESSEFSKKFFVKCADKKFAFDVVHPRMMEFLLAAAQRGEAEPIMICGGCCLISDGHKTWAAAEFRERLKWLDEFFTLWPEYLMSELDGKS